MHLTTPVNYKPSSTLTPMLPLCAPRSLAAVLQHLNAAERATWLGGLQLDSPQVAALWARLPLHLCLSTEQTAMFVASVLPGCCHRISTRHDAGILPDLSFVQQALRHVRAADTMAHVTVTTDRLCELIRSSDETVGLAERIERFHHVHFCQSNLIFGQFPCSVSLFVCSA